MQEDLVDMVAHTADLQHIRVPHVYSTVRGRQQVAVVDQCAQTVARFEQIGHSGKVGVLHDVFAYINIVARRDGRGLPPGCTKKAQKQD